MDGPRKDDSVTYVHAHLVDGVGTITLDRTGRMNSLDVRMAQDLRRAALQFARDEAVRVIVLAGAGGVFCAGADLKYIAAEPDRDDLEYLKAAAPSAVTRDRSRASSVASSSVAQVFSPASSSPAAQGPGYGDRFKQILEYLHSTISEFRRAPKPVIAAVDGLAAAGGLGLAMACDLVVASERAAFEWAYFRTGLSGAESTTFFLPRLVGWRSAMELALLNPRLDAHAARELGLVTRVFPTEEFVRELSDLARTLAQGPTEAYATAKRLINNASGMERLDDHLDRELVELTRIANRPDFARGLEAFFAKTTPVFEGR
jgi:2-(1,2-epoxy-1,2-dihydrophenyl)acetyl-CoA isomerase